MPFFIEKYVGMDFSKFKCRLVVLGNKWKNLHNSETYSGMVSMDTMKLLLSIAVTLDYDMILMDLVCAFLTMTVNKQRPRHSPADPPPPDETYYVRRPPGLTDADIPYIIQPAAFIYGHPLAGRVLRLDLNAVLIDLGFVSTSYDSTMYTLHKNGSSVFMATAVDDMPLFTSDISIKEFVISGLKAKYELIIKDALTTVLGLEVVRLPHRRIQLRQRAHTLEMFKEFLSNWESLPIYL